jgi:hypothetical protein
MGQQMLKFVEKVMKATVRVLMAQNAVWTRLWPVPSPGKNIQF